MVRRRSRRRPRRRTRSRRTSLARITRDSRAASAWARAMSAASTIWRRSVPARFSKREAPSRLPVHRRCHPHRRGVVRRDREGRGVPSRGPTSLSCRAGARPSWAVPASARAPDEYHDPARRRRISRRNAPNPNVSRRTAHETQASPWMPAPPAAQRGSRAHLALGEADLEAVVTQRVHETGQPSARGKPPAPLVGFRFRGNERIVARRRSLKPPCPTAFR